MPTAYCYFRIDPRDLDTTCPRCRGRIRCPGNGGEVTCGDCEQHIEFDRPESVSRMLEAFQRYIASVPNCPEKVNCSADVADANRSVTDRPQWNEIWRTISRGDWLVLPMSAFGDGADAAAAFGRVLRLAQVHILKSNGTSIVLEPGSPAAEAFKEIEGRCCCTIRDRVRANRAAKAREQGKARNQWCGRGWRWDRDSRTGALRRVPDEEQRALMARIIDLRDTGWSWRDIFDLLVAEGVKSPRGRPSAVRSLQRLYADGARLFADGAAEAA